MILYVYVYYTAACKWRIYYEVWMTIKFYNILFRKIIVFMALRWFLLKIKKRIYIIIIIISLPIHKTLQSYDNQNNSNSNNVFKQWTY